MRRSGSLQFAGEARWKAGMDTAVQGRDGSDGQRSFVAAPTQAVRIGHRFLRHKEMTEWKT